VNDDFFIKIKFILFNATFQLKETERFFLYLNFRRSENLRPDLSGALFIFFQEKIKKRERRAEKAPKYSKKTIFVQLKKRNL